MSNPSDSAKLSETDSSVNPISIIRDTHQSGRLMRGATECGVWHRSPGGPVGAEVDGRHFWSVEVGTVRALLQRNGYAVA